MSSTVTGLSTGLRAVLLGGESFKVTAFSLQGRQEGMVPKAVPGLGRAVGSSPAGR